jgi:hypothetical protein
MDEFVPTPCSTCAHAQSFTPTTDTTVSAHYVMCTWKPQVAAYWFMGPMHTLHKPQLVRLKQSTFTEPVVCEVWEEARHDG